MNVTLVANPQNHLRLCPKSNTETSAEPTAERQNTPPGRFAPPPQGRATKHSEPEIPERQRADAIIATSHRAYEIYETLRIAYTGKSGRQRKTIREELGLVLQKCKHNETRFSQALERFFASNDRYVVENDYDYRFFTEDADAWLATPSPPVHDDPSVHDKPSDRAALLEAMGDPFADEEDDDPFAGDDSEPPVSNLWQLHDVYRQLEPLGVTRDEAYIFYDSFEGDDGTPVNAIPRAYLEWRARYDGAPDDPFGDD